MTEGRDAELNNPTDELTRHVVGELLLAVQLRRCCVCSWKDDFLT